MRLIILIAFVALIATVFSAPSPKDDHHLVQERDAWSPHDGPFGVAKDGTGGVEGASSDQHHDRSKRWGGWGWGRPWGGMGWRRPWGMGWRRPWGMGMGGWGGYGGYGWGR
ncbi:Protein CBR-CNC-6 [Caenorhabditis briggsae]|uniref:Protein CBR-CNC-6 n=2 Tax=Caenorhabditis briggsae TaxID=6238 RepID=A8XLE8_CAEBR|nr:Protein CBR-CNC-6 [Caenorhabditis briggsae]ULT98592.1 hypothetical protein L3Y34_000155 [Caenorhabditis briggsae]CAP33613.1 Protein CBR-CNC-6 [Caenorhabditis briggsae]